MSILTTSDIERINEESLRILSETGVQVDDDGVVALLQENGCSAVEGTRVVRMPPEVVEAALKQCPREVKLVSLDGQQVVLSAGGPSLFWTGNAINLAIDKKAVPIDTNRFADLVHVVDGLENVHGMVSTCLDDVPPPVRGLNGARLSLFWGNIALEN